MDALITTLAITVIVVSIVGMMAILFFLLLWVYYAINSDMVERMREANEIRRRWKKNKKDPD
jgi:ABC-type Na+ efflux pump permease subunit